MGVVRKGVRGGVRVGARGVTVCEGVRVGDARLGGRDGCVGEGVRVVGAAVSGRELEAPRRGRRGGTRAKGAWGAPPGETTTCACVAPQTYAKVKGIAT